jgi:glutathione synthase/RimK-type ligase-like ATP-grasp enzyme
MLEKIKDLKAVKKIRKTPLYSRMRQYFPMPVVGFVDDSDRIDDAEIVTIDWPRQVKKPRVGIVQDYGEYPRWTKYRRFLDNNAFQNDVFSIHAHDWIEKAKEYDVFVGVPSSNLFHLQEIRRKYFVLETYLGKFCYPSFKHIMLYEDKTLEAYISKITGIPFVNTYISYDKDDALRLIEKLSYPFVSKIDPTSGSVGVQLVRSPKQARHIVEQAFSNNGRKTHVVYFRQKNYVYFQDYVPNDGYDIRAIIIGDWVFGYYRKVLEGDFRASGMNLVEKRALPDGAIKLARNINQIVQSPQLVVDMVRGLDGLFYIIEFSPICQMELPEELHVNGIPGVYIFDDDHTYHFEEGRYWLHELALKEFFLKDYLSRLSYSG